MMRRKKRRHKKRPMAKKLESRKSMREARLRDLRGCFNEGLEVGRRECDHHPPPRREEKAMSV